MKKAFAVILLIMTFLACSSDSDKKTKDDTSNTFNYILKFTSETPQDLKTPESVLYYKEKDILFVSNINGYPTDKDTNGFISIIDKLGNVVELKWVTGLNAPKGMGTYEGKLYVTDIDRIAIIDIDSAKIEKFIPVDGAKFLNDIAIDANGVVYISDSENNLVYKLENDTVSVFVTDLKGANGLYIEDKTLYVGCNDRLAAVDLNTGKVSTVSIVNTVMIDGLKKVDENGFIITDWQGTISYLDVKNKKTYQLLILAGKRLNAADIEYIPEYKLVYIPTFFDNRVKIYTLTTNSNENNE